MSTSKSISLKDVVRTITDHPLRSAAPVVVVTLLALVYALVGKPTWEASQALLVRDEAGDRLTRPGKFAHADEMKASQETILELVKSRNVLSKTLSEVGPSKADGEATNWPTDRDIEQLQGRVKIVAPKGAEFGKTEVFYLKVQDTDLQRAKELAQAICRQLQARFSKLREARAHSTVTELAKTVELAAADLAGATESLRKIEEQVGRDLSELRILNESPAGDSELRRTATELERDLRTYRAVQSENEELLKLLTSALNDPDKLLASPAVLLKSQPGLGRLKDGLVDAQLKLNHLQGTMSDEHPLVQGAHAAEAAIRSQLHDEIAVAVEGIEVENAVNAHRIKNIEAQDAELRNRFSQLASVRAEYSNLVAAAKNRAETLKTVEHELAEARGSEAAARTASLIGLVDAPDAGTRPIGPARSMIVLGGMAGGLLIGLALVVLTVSPAAPPAESAGQKTVRPAVRAAAHTAAAPLRYALRMATGDGIYSP